MSSSLVTSWQYQEVEEQMTNNRDFKNELEIFKKSLSEVVELSEKDSETFPLEEVYSDLTMCLKDLIKEDNHILVRLNKRGAK